MAPWGILTLICVTFIFVEARRYHQKRETKSHLCDPVFNNTNKIQCYCVKDSRENELIKSADCYSTVDGISQDDPNWKNFDELKNVGKLTFTNTRGVQIKYIPKNALKHTNALLKLEVKYGNVAIIEPFAFANLSHVKEIILTDNQIRILKTNAFAHHADLATIGLDTNAIVEINRDVFIDLPSLEKIYLTSNKITTIHDRAFVHLTNLRELEIDRNNLFSLNSETFSGLKKLEKLDLSGNSLEVIGDNTFVPLKNLRSLNLEGNKIQMLDEKAFKGLSRLTSLSLAHNVLTEIDNNKIFDGLKALSLMNLKGNQLKMLKPDVMAPIVKNFYSNVSSLNVEDNNFPCDCRLDWFVYLMNHTRSPHLKLSIENLKCTPSNELREKWMKTIEAEKNAQDQEDVEGVAGADYEYYDETQLNGNLFYTDLRFLLNCTDKVDNAPNVTPNIATKPINSSTESIKVKETTVATKIVTLVTTHKPIKETQLVNRITPTQGILDLSMESSTTEAASVNENKEENKEKKPNPYTTSRLATVSANPIEKKGYDDREMASDEAVPDKIKAHRSIQEMKDIRDYSASVANKNVVSLLALMILFITFL
ncbi:connectin-like [Vanessa atalanta]|uniref:connectin-like n=1 Tax=Vanessa atalanta TaxID=42275 RepID=UPI001FCE09CD|nr:connectin-like [Vanessa atalanta]XP_047534162.1 connectin-like [Vanessa atalanta]XP_047534163.1 connectin-like [Vanessa atalanta]